MLSKEKINEKFKKNNLAYEALEGLDCQDSSIMFKHLDCGTIFKANYKSLRSRSIGCPNCTTRKKWTTNKINNFLKEKYENEYKLLLDLNDSYITTKSRVRIEHEKCKNSYDVLICNLLSGYKCPFCSKNNNKKNYKETFKDIVSSTREYILLGSYNKCGEKTLFKHLECGRTFEMRPENFLQGQRCPYCRKNHPYTLETIKEKVSIITNNEYAVVDTEYNGVGKPLKIFHTKCNRIFETKMSDFISGRT